jgi:putative addiction module component (TIGR02574 family)
MTATAQKVLDEALQLPEDDRDWIADSLWRSIDRPTEEDAEPLDPAWEAEIERRIEDVRSGKVKMVPHEEAMARIRSRLGR